MKLNRFCYNINGVDRYVVCEPQKDSLAEVLRRMGLTGTKIGCGIGVCGACTVIVDGKLVKSCTRKMKSVPEFAHITTIEGIGCPGHLHPLQQAWITYGGVQCGFCSPGFIVAAKVLLDANPSPTREEVRAWFRKNRNICRCTGYKPLVDCVMAAAAVLRGEKTMDDITYKAPEGSLYGSGLPRPAALAKVCGLCDYGDDLKFKMPPETLHLALVQPKITHHANILNIDYSEAMKMPGVAMVITAKDVKGSNIISVPLGHARSKVREENWPILTDKKIFRYGDVVAVVAADTEERARAAAGAVKVEIEQLPEYTNYLDAVMPDAMQIHEGVPNIFMEQPVLKGEGDTRDVIENAEYSIEGSFYSTREPHLSIESDPIQSYIDEDGMVTIQCKTQYVYGVLNSMYAGIGVPKEKLRIIENPTGASFGYAVNPHSYAIAAVCAMALDNPVTLTLSYEEHNHLSGKRCAAFFNGRLACDENGKLQALEADMGVDHGAYHQSADALIDRFIRFIGFPYNIPNVTGLARMAYSNHNFGTSYRGFGAPQTLTCLEAMVDMLAEKAGIDPFEFRYMNVAREGELSINSYPFREYPMVGIMDAARPIYEEMVKKAAAESAPEKRRAVGVACGGFSCTGGGGDTASIYLELNPDGTFTHYGTWEDQGQGGDAGVVMHVCEALRPLGVTPDMVRPVMSDSKFCPDSGIAGGSRSHMMTGMATIQAANKLMDAMRKSDGTYRTNDEMVAEGIPTKFAATHEQRGLGLVPLDPNNGKGDPSPTLMYGLFLADVEVDTKTGRTKVLSYVTVDDIGTVGNSISVEGQAFGGASHCIGFALSENYDDVKKCNNIYACGIPSIDDIPDDLRLIHVHTDRPSGPYGSAGCSELYQSGGHMAVINGINRATGVRIYELPATPEKVKAGLDIIAAGGKTEPPARYFLGSDLYDEIEELVANPV
ncbi:MAG: molybdopterin-dependent aldehyde oxidoreductase [Oscillospiraceae bacterium]